MYFLYIDESGDPGPIIAGAPATPGNPSKHYILSGVAINATEWRSVLTRMVNIRRLLKARYGFPVRAELHGSEFFRPKHPPYKNWGPRKRRLQMYHEYLNLVTTRMPSIRLFNVHVNKVSPKSRATVADSLAVRQAAWLRMFQRFNTYLQRDCRDLGLIVSDQGDEAGMRRYLRAKRLYNLAPTRTGGAYSVALHNIVKDPIMRDSKFSYIVQLADMTSHALYRKLYPKGSYKKYRADYLFDRLAPLCHKPASAHDPYGLGIVHC